MGRHADLHRDLKQVTAAHQCCNKGSNILAWSLINSNSSIKILIFKSAKFFQFTIVFSLIKNSKILRLKSIFNLHCNTDQHTSSKENYISVKSILARLPKPKIGIWCWCCSTPNYTNYMDDNYLSSFIQVFDLVPATFSFSDRKHYTWVLVKTVNGFTHRIQKITEF